MRLTNIWLDNRSCLGQNSNSRPELRDSNRLFSSTREDARGKRWVEFSTLPAFQHTRAIVLRSGDPIVEGGGMARIRSIKPEFPQSESLGRVSREARLLFISLWTICDDEGRTRAASRLLASLLYPYDDDAPSLIDGWLTELSGIGAIRRYVVDGSTYLDIPNWLKHQKIDKPGKSRLPAFYGDSRTFENIREESTTDLGPRTLDLGKDLGVDGSAATVVASAPNHSKPTNLINGRQQLNHGSHAWCSLPREGLCVPTHAFHVELMGRAVKSEAEIKAIYRQVVDRHEGVPMTGDIFAFWRKEVDAVAGAKPQTALYDPDAGRRTREELARKRAMGAAQ